MLTAFSRASDPTETISHLSAKMSRAACRPSPRSRYAAWANRPAPLRVAEAPHPFTAQGCRIRPRPISSSPQFSAPCPPHCGSAAAPPRFPRACAIHSLSAHRRNSLIASFGVARGCPKGGYCARAARAPRPVDGKCWRISTGSLYPPFFVRALAEILFKREQRV